MTRIIQVFILSLVLNGCAERNETFEYLLADSYKDITRIEAYATCQGPNGTYRTTVKNIVGSIEFKQEFSYRDTPFHGMVTANNEGFIIDSLGNRTDTLSKEVIEILRSHAFHKIHIHPEFLFSNIQYQSEERDLQLFKSTDRLGNPVVITYDQKNRWIEKFIMRNPMDTAEQIEVRYSYAKETRFGPLAKELLIIQGGKDEFTFHFDSVFINDQKITF